MSYIVFRDDRGYLALNGPFAYPVWVFSREQATPLGWLQAHAYAAAYGGEVRTG